MSSAFPGLLVFFLCSWSIQSLVHVQREHHNTSMLRAHVYEQMSSFISMDGSVCFQGPPPITEGALATMKSSPWGRMYWNSWAVPSTNCINRGYRSESEESTCYPGVKTYYKDKRGHTKAQDAYNRALENYRSKYNLDNNTVRLLAKCSCHPKSMNYNMPDSQCKSITLTGSWLHSNSEDSLFYQCLEGPFEHMIRVLSVMKTSKQLLMHMHDQLAPQSCKARGFKEGPMHMTKDDDDDHCHCFPPAKEFFKTKMLLDKGAAYETEVLRTSFWSYAKSKGLDAKTLGTYEFCNCLPSSAVGQWANQQLCNNVLNIRSPIRDWWSG